MIIYYTGTEGKCPPGVRRMKDVLVLNCFKRDDYATDFNRAISRLPGQADTHSVRMTDLEPALELTPFSHLIISGSETSALENYEWTSPLEEVIRKWVETKKPVLGICYGHQFLVRLLAGVECVRPARPPEFGWADVTLAPCALFEGMKRLTVMVSHYDEVINLPSDFTVLAETKRCGIHAFQYRDYPVWGIQFHPEYGQKEAEFIFQQVRKSDPVAEKWFIGTLPQSGELAHCKQIFDNFLAM